MKLYRKTNSGALGSNTKTQIFDLLDKTREYNQREIRDELRKQKDNPIQNDSELKGLLDEIVESGLLIETDAINITFDLETFGITHNAPILQIGAVKFNNEGQIMDKFNIKINPSDLETYNFDLNYSTIMWWLSQKKEVIDKVFFSNDEHVNLDVALNSFNNWIGYYPQNYVYWSHTTFDPVILSNAFKKAGIKSVIPYYQHRDIRTLEEISAYQMRGERTGNHHDALDDSITQAAYISNALKYMKNKNI